MPRPASKIHAVVALKSTLRFISNLAALVPAECNDALQVSTLGEKSISGCEVPPFAPQPIRNYIHVDSSSDRPAMVRDELRRMANICPRLNRAGLIDLLANCRPCAGVLPLASTRFTSVPRVLCLPQQPKNAWRPRVS